MNFKLLLSLTLVVVTANAIPGLSTFTLPNISIPTLSMPNVSQVFSTTNADKAVKGMLAVAVGNALYSGLKNSFNSIVSTTANNFCLSDTCLHHDQSPRTIVCQDAYISADHKNKIKKAAGLITAVGLGLFAVNSTTGIMITNESFKLTEQYMNLMKSILNSLDLFKTTLENNVAVINKDESINIIKNVSRVINNS